MSTPQTRTPQRTTRWRRVQLLQRASLVILLAFVLLLVGLRVSPAPWRFPTFPKLTHTARGAAGDPLNIILVGSASQITQSFARAGWLVPDPITSHTSARIIAASLAHQPYPTAPVSALYVFGRVQDRAFERPTNDVQNRGHIRLWQTTTQLGGQPVWLGQASYDQGIELSGTTAFPTHHISPAVDLERDGVGTDLARTGLVVAEAHEAFTAPVFVAYNGGGDYYASDGDVLVLTYSHAALPLPASTGLSAVASALKHGFFRGYDVVLTTLPLQIAALLVGIVLVVLALWPVLRWLWWQFRVRWRRATGPA
ncbi:MAG TPA: LssY C-terminal domain-containing protein [Ktedonobacterales bacterium]|nr:LssY C-terminal domain-containing protein [Ktedonobacterales bacterium]